MMWTFAGASWATLAPIGGAVAAALVALYVLRLRRQRVEVPFAPLWQRVLEERSANQLWEKLKRLLSLLLQLALLGVLLLALADPQGAAQREEGRSVVILLDASASMQARDEVGGRDRFERAVEHVRDTIDALGPKDEAMLVVVDHAVRPLTPFVNDAAALERALIGVTATDTPGQLAEALRFGGDALRDRARAHLVVASDGAGRDAERVDLPAHVALHLHEVGRSRDNVGITAFNARRYPANRTDFEVYVRVENFAEAPAEIELSIWANGRMSERAVFTLDAGASATRILSEVPAAGDELEARLRVVAGDVVDVFPLDDTAYARVPEARPLRVLAVTEGNLYLEGPLLLNPSLDVRVVTPDAYAAPNAGDPSAGFDVTIFDGVTPSIADRGNFLFFAPSGASSPWAREDDATVDDPIIHSAQTGHPLLRWISALRDVNIREACACARSPTTASWRRPSGARRCSWSAKSRADAWPPSRSVCRPRTCRCASRGPSSCSTRSTGSRAKTRACSRPTGLARRGSCPWAIAATCPSASARRAEPSAPCAAWTGSPVSSVTRWASGRSSSRTNVDHRGQPRELLRVEHRAPAQRVGPGERRGLRGPRARHLAGPVGAAGARRDRDLAA